MTAIGFREDGTQYDPRAVERWAGQEVPLRVGGRLAGRVRVLDVTVDERGVAWTVEIPDAEALVPVLREAAMPPFSFRFSLDGLDVTAIEAQPRDPLGASS